MHAICLCLLKCQRKAKLSLAGLGERKLSVFLYGDAAALDEEVKQSFPKLAESDGYEFLRCSDRGGKELVPIEIPSPGYSPEYLKSVVSTAKIYIRPLLDTTRSDVRDIQCLGSYKLR